MYENVDIFKEFQEINLLFDLVLLIRGGFGGGVGGFFDDQFYIIVGDIISKVSFS